MLYSDSDLVKMFKPPELNFADFFERNYNALPSMYDVLSSGGYKGCCGAPFVQTNTGVFEAELFGALRHVNILSWTTKNFQNEDRVCARAVFEVFDDGKWFLWNIAFTTCDPFSFDNFNQPLGIFNALSTRASFNEATGKMDLFNDLAPAEYEVFLVNKIKFHKSRMWSKMTQSQSFAYELRALAMTSESMDRVTLRSIVGDYAKHIPTAEAVRLLAFRSFTPEQVKHSEREELDLIREVVRTFTASQFYSLYVDWLNAKLQLPINLYPAEYKKIGRKLLMTPDDFEEWDRIVFLLVLSAHANLVVESPYDSALGFGSGACAFCEISCDDARFAEKTPKSENPDVKIKLGDVSNEWLLRTTEKVVKQQAEFLTHLGDFLYDGDLNGAFKLLTTGTATPRNGQGLLGLSIALLRDLTASVIVFPKPLTDQIMAMMASYDIQWSLPLIEISTNPEGDSEHGHNFLLRLGVPVR
jgi:hypothetical protein